MANRDGLKIVDGFKGRFYFLSPESTGCQLSREPKDREAAAKHVVELLQAKFADPELKAKLLATGDASLLHINGRGDQFWGISGGKGLNVYGKLLMAVRDQLAVSPEPK
jgi:predicted NAD-dependent protein-ADP-ribosyltransferase YbiA (DUF1768 family)